MKKCLTKDTVCYIEKRSGSILRSILNSTDHIERNEIPKHVTVIITF